MEHEITAKGPLLDGRGCLREPGWARSPLLEYERGAVKAPKWRIKEWDYYCLLAGDFGLAFTVADNGYMGLLSVSVLDLAARAEVTETVMTALPLGRWGLPPTSKTGVTEARAGGITLRFETKEGGRNIFASCPGFGASSRGRAAALLGGGRKDGAVGFEAELRLAERPGGESMVIATPFHRAPRAFYYNQKINCQDVEGRAKVGTREFRLEHGKAFGVLDWGRGVWTWKNTWLWGSASGFARFEEGGERLPFGFNIGGGFGDTRAASENMVFVDGRAHKFGALDIELDDRDYLRPWRARSEDGRFDLVLSPVLDRASSADFLALASIQHQVFGSWSGRIVLEGGRVVLVEKLLGFCEKVRNRW